LKLLKIKLQTKILLYLLKLILHDDTKILEAIKTQLKIGNDTLNDEDLAKIIDSITTLTIGTQTTIILTIIVGSQTKIVNIFIQKQTHVE
jgi:hypothetical protein